MTDLPSISVVVCTRDRPRDLTELLQTLLTQNYSPFEVIVVDDSLLTTVRKVVDSFQQRFDDGRLRYIKGSGDGLPAARNLGAKMSQGDVILFLDDDTLLRNDVLLVFASFLKTHPNAMGIQGQIRRSVAKSGIANASYKTFMLFYYKQNKLAVRRSGTSIFPYFYLLTVPIDAQRLDGCCMCYRRELFNEFSFDANLKKWGFMEDLDFSYRIYKRYPGTLYALPEAAITHKKSKQSRLPSRSRIYMVTIHWFYVFFKDVLEGSILNLVAFLWALVGNFVTLVGGFLAKRRSKLAWWDLIYLSRSYAVALANLKAVISGELEFFNKSLNGQDEVENE